MTTIDIVFEGEPEPWVVARAAQRGTQTFIEYTDDHVARRIELAPVRHLTHTRSRTFDGRSAEHLPGLLSDTLPDSWGQLVLRRDMRQHGIQQPTPLQMLTWLGTRTMGALTFRPVDGPTPTAVTLVDLDRVQDEMLRHLADAQPQDLPADALTRAAGSGGGGARPKFTAAYTPDGTLVVDDGTVPDGSTPWLVKLHSDDDTEYLSAIEATYLQMAADAGISVCDHRLLAGSSGVRYLAVLRFDRVTVPGGQPSRVHMATAAGLLEAYPEYNQHLSYDDLIRLTRHVTGDVRDVEELVRRAVFNVIAHNRDDHARNFTYLWTPDGWHLAPAYDLTYSMGPRPVYAASEPGGHYLDIAGKGSRISRQDLHSLSKASGLRTAEIDEMVDRTTALLSEWPERAVANGVDPQLVAQAAARLPALDR